VEFTFGQYNWPLFVAYGLFVLNAFAAFFLSVVQYFAINTEFTISGGIGFWLIGILGIVETGPVALSS
jgi:hypothetical protein